MPSTTRGHRQSLCLQLHLRKQKILDAGQDFTAPASASESNNDNFPLQEIFRKIKTRKKMKLGEMSASQTMLWWCRLLVTRNAFCWVWDAWWAQKPPNNLLRTSHFPLSVIFQLLFLGLFRFRFSECAKKFACPNKQHRQFVKVLLFFYMPHTSYI